MTKKVTQKTRKKNMDRMISQGFIGILVVFMIVNLLVPSKTFSSQENRNLQQRPSISLTSLSSGKFFQDFNTYYSDQFVARDGWVSLQSMGSSLLGAKESNGVYIGKDHYLIQKPSTPDTKAIKNSADAMNTFVNNHTDISMYVMVVPDASVVMNDKLPRNAPVRNQEKDIQKFTNQLSSSIVLLDAQTPLSQASKKQQVYYRTDHHWTSVGAYATLESVANDMNLSLVEYKSYLVSNRFQGTLASKAGKHGHSDSIEVYEPQSDVEYIVNYMDTGTKSTSVYVKDKLQEKDQYQLFFGGNHPMMVIRTTADNGRNLLVFKDSYANSFLPLLTPYYTNIVVVDPRYYYENVETLISTYIINEVLCLYSADTLLVDTNLADTLNSAIPMNTEEETEQE